MPIQDAPATSEPTQDTPTSKYPMPIQSPKSVPVSEIVEAFALGGFRIANKLFVSLCISVPFGVRRCLCSATLLCRVCWSPLGWCVSVRAYVCVCACACACACASACACACA
eukprot:13311951-Alexandrium_andersonii.AAC.1